MDPESVNNFLERMGKRHQILDTLDTSIMSEAVGEKEPLLSPIKESKELQNDADELADLPFIDSTTDALEKENAPTSPLKSKFARLSEGYKSFEVDYKASKITKENVVHGPVKRVSIGGSEKTAQEFFAPKSGSTSSPNTSLNQPNLATPPVGIHKTAATSTPRGTEEPPKLTFSPVMKVNSENDCSSNKQGESQGVLIFDSSITTEYVNNETKVTTQVVKEKTFSVSNVGLELSNAGSQCSSFGGKVKALKSMFDNQNSVSKTESNIDGSSTNFQKARGLFESPTRKYQSPSIIKKNQGVTSIRKYDGPPPPSVPYTKKPASCEIIVGPSFSDSVNYWKDRVRENPEPNDDLMNAALSLAAKSQKREATKTPGQLFRLANDRSNELVSPVPKISKFSETYEGDEKITNLSHIQEEHENNDEREDEKVDFMDEVEEKQKSSSANNLSGSAGGNRSSINESACFNSWNEKFKIKPFVMTESFITEKSSSDSSNSITVASESFDYQRFPTKKETPKKEMTLAVLSLPESTNGASLLDDINQEIDKFHTPRRVSENDDENITNGKLAHSLSHYRKNEATPKIIPTRPTKDAVDEFVASEEVIKDNRKFMTEKERQTKIKQLEDMVQLQYKHASQIAAALMTLRREGKFTGTSTEIECLQKITIANERRRVCALEANMLLNKPNPSYLVPRAKIRFNKITVRLCRDLAPTVNHYVYLFVMIKHRDQIAATSPVCVNEALHRGIGYVEFTDGLVIEKASADFSVLVEVYGATLIIKEQKMDKGIFNLKKIMNSPAPERSNANSGPEQFTRIGQLTLTAADLHECPQRTLSHVEFPIEPKIAFAYSCQVTDYDDSKWQGFISIYRTVEGRGAWELNYGKIVNGRLNLWKYPEDAEVKSPLLSLNIRDMSGQAEPINNEEVGFQYDFVMKMIDAKDSVVRIMLSTAEEDEREHVLATINRSYKFHTTWAQF